MNKELEKHVSFTTSADIGDISRPLNDFFNVNFFIYQRNLIDNTATNVKKSAFLCNNAHALDFILSLPKTNRESAKYDFDDKGRRKYVLLETTQPKFANLLRSTFNFNNILCRDEQIGPNEWEHFILGTASNDLALVNNYLNGLELLDKYAGYFRDKARNLIKKACDNRIRSGRVIEKCSFQHIYDVKTNAGYASFMQSIHSDKYYLTDSEGSQVALTKGETKCVTLLAKGRTGKEIARILSISPRTVETHLKNCRIKLKCHTKGMLLDIFERAENLK
ncbi:MAG: helix-turn-helix transcriptional regulator [Gammaproteobacteria bacterium]|nr:helix-turn-helix transcriptional regulator [Gammaproteobacteria bacterium]